MCEVEAQKETLQAGGRSRGKSAWEKRVNYTSLEDAVAAAGLGAPHVIHDGLIHRFTSPDDRPGSNNCWYVSHRTAGAFGSWKLGFTRTWSDGKASNNAALLAEIKKYQRQREVDLEIIRNDAATEARQLWLAASTEIVHTYPTRKKITPYCARQTGNVLLVPMYFNGKLVNLQHIYPNGSKRFMKSCRVTGCYLPMGDLSDHIHVCEGYATGCSLLDHLPAPAAVCAAFNAGNLKQAALSIRKKYPKVRITVCADNDIETERKTGINPGLEKGRAAAAAVGGDVIYPIFDPGQERLSDYNDYFNAGGKL